MERRQNDLLQQQSQEEIDNLQQESVNAVQSLQNLYDQNEALKQQVAGSTILIVAQRISTILHAEQILVLDEGRIVGAGTHQELLQTCEAYRQIAESQLSEAELDQVKCPSGAAEHRGEQKGGASHG